ncbi:MAG: c-type cytochrome [Terracidiphilus sp.]
MKHSTRRLLAAFFLVLSGALAFSAAVHPHWDHIPPKDHARANPLAGNVGAVAAGALVYSDHCAECHKANARGDGHKHPSLHSEHITSATDGDLEWFLRQGDLAHGMPSWSSLPTEQRWQLVAYLRSIQ